MAASEATARVLRGEAQVELENGLEMLEGYGISFATRLKHPLIGGMTRDAHNTLSFRSAPTSCTFVATSVQDNILMSSVPYGLGFTCCDVHFHCIGWWVGF